MKKHKHHIIPKHAGGTDDITNLVELTIEEHALAHKLLYEKYGRWQDRVAWLSLSGIMKDEERIYEILKNSNPGGYTHSEESRKKISMAQKGKKKKYPPWNKGKTCPGIGGRKKGTKWSDNERLIQEKIRSAPGYYDFNKDPIRNKKISDAKKGTKGSACGKSWYNNGKIETYDFNCPNGFIKGRLPRLQLGKRGLVWFNNGQENKQYKEGNQPEGFIRGRISKK